MMHKILFAALVCAAFGLSAGPVAPECVISKDAKVEDGMIKASVKNARFCYLIFKLPEAVKFDPAQCMTFEFRMTTQGEEATFVNQLVFGKKQTWNGNDADVALERPQRRLHRRSCRVDEGPYPRVQHRQCGFQGVLPRTGLTCARIGF